MNTLTKDIFLFIRSGKTNSIVRDKFYKFILIFIFIEVLSFLTFVVILSFIHSLNLEVSRTILLDHIREHGVLDAVIKGGILAPIIEEIGFRICLIYSPMNFSLMIGTWFYLFLGYVINTHGLLGYDNIAVVRLIACIFLSGVIFLYLNKNNHLNSAAQQLWRNRPLLVLYTFVFVFSFLHITNYRWNLQTLLLTPFLTLPQSVSGITFSYARLKYGLAFSVFLHSICNLIVILIVGYYF